MTSINYSSGSEWSMSYGNCKNSQMPDMRSSGFCYRNDNGRVDYGTWGDPRCFDDFGPVVNSNVTNNNFIFANNMPPMELPMQYPVQHRQNHQMQGAPEVNFFNVNMPPVQQQQQPMQFSPVPGININVVYGQPNGEDAKPHSLEGFVKRMLDDAKCPCKLADRVKKAGTAEKAKDIIINLSRDPKRFAKETTGLNIEDVKELIRSIIAEEKQKGEETEEGGKIADKAADLAKNVEKVAGKVADKPAENKGGFFAKILGKDAPAVKTVEDPELRKRVAANEERIAKLEKAVAEEQEKNKKLAANDKRQDGIIAVQSAKIKEQTGKITDLGDKVATQEKLGADRQVKLDEMKKKADLMEADLKKADSSSISALDAANKAAKSIEGLTVSLAGLDTKLTGIKDDTGKNTTSLAGHAASLTASQSDIAKLTEAVKAVDKKVGIIAGMVAEQTGKTLPADVTKPADVTTQAEEAKAKTKADADAKAKADAARAKLADPAEIKKLGIEVVDTMLGLQPMQLTDAAEKAKLKDLFERVKIVTESSNALMDSATLQQSAQERLRANPANMAYLAAKAGLYKQILVDPELGPLCETVIKSMLGDDLGTKMIEAAKKM